MTIYFLKMKHYIITLVYLFFIIGCCSEKTDQVFLDQDKKKLEERLNQDKILFYKFAKIIVRSTAVQDTTLPSYQKFSKQIQCANKTLKTVDPKDKESISIIDALRLYKEYRSVKDLVKETDEDVFPTLIEVIITMCSDLKPTII